MLLITPALFYKPKWLQISGIFLNILANLNNTVICRISIVPLNSNSVWFFFHPLTIIGIYIFFFHGIFQLSS